MALLDELKKIARPFNDDDDYIENDEYDEYDEEEEEGFTEEYDDAPEQEAKPSAPRSGVFNRREREVRSAPAFTPADRGGSGKMKLVICKPEAFEEAAEIAQNLCDRRAVLINLEETNKDVSRRLIDFLSGVAFALGGKIKRVSAQAYILTPTNVDLVGDAVEDFESSGIYF